MTHVYLTDLDDRGLQREIGEAKAELEEITGKPVEHFSCPGGRCDARAIQVARHAGYRSVANSRVRQNRTATDSFDLGRIAILRETDLQAFQKICRAESLWKIQARSRLRGAAKQVLGNSLYDRGRALSAPVKDAFREGARLKPMETSSPAAISSQTTSPPDSKISVECSSPVERKLRPVFVIGCHRSGTNLLYDTLLSAGGFAVYRGYLPVYKMLIPRFGSLAKRSNRSRMINAWVRSKGFRRSGLDAEQLKARVQDECRSGGDFIRIVMSEIARNQSVVRWVLYDPDNLLYIPRIQADIPEALFVHIIRDGRDVALSLSKMGWIQTTPMESKQQACCRPRFIGSGWFAGDANKVCASPMITSKCAMKNWSLIRARQCESSRSFWITIWTTTASRRPAWVGFASPTPLSYRKMSSAAHSTAGGKSYHAAKLCRLRRWSASFSRS